MKTIPFSALRLPEVIALVKYANDMLANSNTYPVEYELGRTERDSNGKAIAVYYQVDSESLAEALAELGYNDIYARLAPPL